MSHGSRMETQDAYCSQDTGLGIVSVPFRESLALQTICFMKRSTCRFLMEIEASQVVAVIVLICSRQPCMNLHYGIAQFLIDSFYHWTLFVLLCQLSHSHPASPVICFIEENFLTSFFSQICWLKKYTTVDSYAMTSPLEQPTLTKSINNVNLLCSPAHATMRDCLQSSNIRSDSHLWAPVYSTLFTIGKPNSKFEKSYKYLPGM